MKLQVQTHRAMSGEGEHWPAQPDQLNKLKFQNQSNTYHSHMAFISLQPLLLVISLYKQILVISELKKTQKNKNNKKMQRAFPTPQ